MAGKTGGYEFTALTSVASGGDVVSMDPRLQHLLALRQEGGRKPASASTTADEVAVVAKVSDLAAWEALSEVHAGAVIGVPDEHGVVIVTGRVPVARLEQVRSQVFVRSLKAAQRLSRSLAATTTEIQATPAALPANRRHGGKGAIVGIVDFGCDFAHQNLRTSAGKTRVLKLWDQGATGHGEGTYDYGKVHLPPEINSALGKADPYGALGYGPDPAEPAHGTHVTDIAAGNGRGTGVPGVAPQADLIFVEAASSDIAWGGSEAVGQSFGDSVQLLEALSFIFESAGTTPCAINMSLGTNGGPHDGSTLVEQGIDRLLTAAPNRAVCIAASNSFDDHIHAAGTVPKAGSHDLAWIVDTVGAGGAELELWYPGANRLSVELIAPGGQSVGTLSPGKSGSVKQSGKVVLFVANRIGDPNNGDNTIGIFLAPGVPPGSWLLRLRATNPKKATPYHAWTERSDGAQSHFGAPADDSHTIGSVSCGHNTIVVGSYDAHKPTTPISWFSSAGPTRDGREKPEVSAPGHDVLAAASRTGNGTTRMSGTSMAAPATTGAVALLLAEAKALGQSLTIDEIRDLVLTHARKNPPADAGWDARYGNGRISAAAMVTAL